MRAKHIYYLRIENAEGYVLIAVYSFIYLYACYSHNTKSIKPNRMKFGGMIVHYPGTIWFWDRSGQGHEKDNIFLNRMKFGGMIGYYPGTIWLDFGINRVKGQRSMSWKGQHLLFTIARSIFIQLASN